MPPGMGTVANLAALLGFRYPSSMKTYIGIGGLMLVTGGVGFGLGHRVAGGASLTSARPPADCGRSGVVGSPSAGGPTHPAGLPSPSSAASAEPPVVVTKRDDSDWPYRTWPEDTTSGDRVYSKLRFLWIRPEPKDNGKWLGYLSLGDSVRLREGDREKAFIRKAGSTHCTAWYAVEPRGYICIDDASASFDRDDADVQLLVERRANPASPWPYHYAESTGTPVYSTIPPLHRQRRNESMLDEHLSRVRRARSAKTSEARIAIHPLLADIDVDLTDAPPPRFVELGPRGRTNKTKVVRKSTLAYTDAFDSDGRSWVQTWDKGIVPRDRIVTYPRSHFHGTSLNDDVRLPLAFFRREQKKYRMKGEAMVEVPGSTWPRHSWTMVTEDIVDIDGKRYVRTRDDDHYVSVDGTTVARQSHAIPPQIKEMKEGRRTWIDISVLRGFLVAYEYDKPVYATLVSPGRGGVPRHGVDPIETASTPVGRFRITSKFLSATMVSNASKDIVHDQVMYTQNFTGPYALHGAYWHDDWGEKKSGGCVNLSPVDARRIFKWTEPQIPAGWHGVQLVTGYDNALAEFQSATLVYAHK
ncbi:MAG: L,D-transpeptidase [Myxococcota bacterium]